MEINQITRSSGRLMKTIKEVITKDIENNNLNKNMAEIDPCNRFHLVG